MTISIPTTPSLISDQDRQVLAPWFELSGLTETSPEWAAVWTALLSAGLARGNSLILWPTETEDCLSTETRAAQYLRTTLAAGAIYANQNPTPTAPQTSPMNAGLGVETVLGLLHKRPTLIGPALDADPDDRVPTLLAAMKSHVVGVFPNAPTALCTLIDETRTSITTSPDLTAPWPPLVEGILRETAHDEVFAEHVILTISEDSAHNIDHVVLPSENWLILRDSDPTS